MVEAGIEDSAWTPLLRAAEHCFCVAGDPERNPHALGIWVSTTVWALPPPITRVKKAERTQSRGKRKALEPSKPG